MARSTVGRECKRVRFIFTDQCRIGLKSCRIILAPSPSNSLPIPSRHPIRSISICKYLEVRLHLPVSDLGTMLSLTWSGNYDIGENCPTISGNYRAGKISGSKFVVQISISFGMSWSISMFIHSWSMIFERWTNEWRCWSSMKISICY